jgi:hypothetical protein
VQNFVSNGPSSPSPTCGMRRPRKVSPSSKSSSQLASLPSPDTISCSRDTPFLKYPLSKVIGARKGVTLDVISCSSTLTTSPQNAASRFPSTFHNAYWALGTLTQEHASASSGFRVPTSTRFTTRAAARNPALVFVAHHGEPTLRVRKLHIQDLRPLVPSFGLRL